MTELPRSLLKQSEAPRSASRLHGDMPDLRRWRRRRRARQDVMHGVGGHKVTFSSPGFLAGARGARRHRRAAHAALPRGRPRCIQSIAHQHIAWLKACDACCQ